MKYLLPLLVMIIVAATVNAAGPAELLTPGQPLPLLKGEFLTGKKVELPSAIAGKTALLALGFSYDSRFAVEAWSNRFRKEFARNPQVTWFEVPMIGGMAKMGKWFIDSGMRRGTPKELQENVITVYGGVDPWKKRLAFNNNLDAHLILVDSTGIVRWVYREHLKEDKMTEAKFAELKAAVDQLAPAR